VSAIFYFIVLIPVLCIQMGLSFMIPKWSWQKWIPLAAYLLGAGVCAIIGRLSHAYAGIIFVSLTYLLLWAAVVTLILNLVFTQIRKARDRAAAEENSPE